MHHGAALSDAVGFPMYVIHARYTIAKMNTTALWGYVVYFYVIVTSPSASGRGAPRSTELTSSLRTSGLICGCGFARMTSSNASFWSGVKSDAYLSSVQYETMLNYGLPIYYVSHTVDRTREETGARAQAASPRHPPCAPCRCLRAG